MRLDDNLLNNVYRSDPFFKKLKEVYDKTKNYTRRSRQIVNNEKDLIQLKLQVKFTKYPDILINQLTEVNFRCKECFKIFLLMYRFFLKTNGMSFECKKEYLRRMIKIHRNVLERGLNELEEKNMILIERINGYFRFTLNLCFLDWNIEDCEKVRLRENIDYEIEWYQERYIQENGLL